MSESLRRSTMQPVDSNARSHIPLPSTVKKPGPVPRMSIIGAPGRTQQPVQSLYRSQNANPLLQSASKPNFRTPLSNARRGSLWPGPAAPAAPSSTLVKDPRPLRDRPYQTKMRQEILDYLRNDGLEISMATLTNIQGKDYRSIFDYLIQNLDPVYPLNQGRFEDEFVPALKALRYPYAHQIDHKWLAAPASMHSWPALLGVLHWLVELCKMKVAYLESRHPSVQNPSDVPEEFDDPLHHTAIAFQLFENSYSRWLDLVDDFSEPKQIIEDRYAKKNESLNRELEALNKQLDEAKLEYDKLKSSAAPIAKLEKENGLLKADSEKFQKILQQYEGRTKKLTETIAFEESELASKRAHLEQLQAELDRLTDIVQTQNLTPEEILQMNTEHDQLARNIDDLKQKLNDAYRTSNREEVNVANRSSATEEAVEAYSNLLATLDTSHPPPPFQDVDLAVELNTAASIPSQLLVGADLRKVIKPALNAIAESKRSERASVESERIKIDNDLDLLTQECENIEEEVLEVDKKANNLNEQAEKLRDAAQRDALVANAEATRLERELAHARNAALANGMGVKTQLQGIQFSYNEQIAKVSRLKEETVRAIVKNSHDIAMFKEEVSRQLMELREVAEGQ